MSPPNPLESLGRILSRLFKPPPFPRKPPIPGAAPAPVPSIQPLNPRVLMIAFNPVVQAATGRRLVATMHWNDPDTLASEYIFDIRECSGGLVNYRIVDRVEADEIPIKADGFRYEPQAYLNAMRAPTELATGSGFHDPDAVDYPAILQQWDVAARVAKNELDEVWLFGGPFFGFSESVMAGAHAFFINGGPVPKTEACPRRFAVMGFNYERGVGEMLEDFGHRCEFTLAHAFGSEPFLWQAYNTKRQPAQTPPVQNLFERFICYDALMPGHANVGTMHYAPNSLRDYDWGNRTPIMSCCEDWLAFPNLPEPPHYRPVSAHNWGDGNIRAHHRWWLSRLPKANGTTMGMSNNWWKYVIQLDDPIFDRPE